MKKWAIAILMCTAVLSAPLSAEVCQPCQTACGHQRDVIVAAPCRKACGRRPIRLDPNPFCHPWWLDTNIYATGEANFESSTVSGEQFRYTQWDVEASYCKQVNALSGVIAGVGYRWTRMGWNNSEFLRHPRFEEVGAFLRGFTHCIDCWVWKFGVGWWQQTYKLNMGRYGMAEFFAWGRYDYIPGRLGLHIGFISLPGKRKGFTRPIFGLDYKFRNGLELDAVYPIDITLLYPVTCWFKTGIAARFNRSRERMRPDDIIPEGIIEYRNWGAEWRAVLEPIPGIKAEAYIGSTIWTFVRVTTQHNKTIVYRNLDPVIYTGAHIFLAY